MQVGRHLLPRDVVADVDVGHQVDQQALAVFTEVLGMHPHADRVGYRDRPVLRDVVLDVHGSHCGERKVEPGHQRHHRGKGQRERVGQRHVVAVAQTGDCRIRGDVGVVDGQFPDGHRAVGQLVSARHERQCPGSRAKHISQAA
jgi:catechol 2,3-dioxygenase-like lactoylglutathione lyase family enzyme